MGLKQVRTRNPFASTLHILQIPPDIFSESTNVTRTNSAVWLALDTLLQLLCSKLTDLQIKNLSHGPIWSLLQVNVQQVNPGLPQRNGYCSSASRLSGSGTIAAAQTSYQTWAPRLCLSFCPHLFVLGMVTAILKIPIFKKVSK